MKLKELMEKRAQAVADARALLDHAERESRDLTDEESRQYDALIDAAGTLKDKVEQERQQRELEREIATADGENRKTAATKTARARPAIVRRWPTTGFGATSATVQREPAGTRPRRRNSET